MLYYFACHSHFIRIPIDIGRKLNLHKTFRRLPGRLLKVLCTFNLRPVSTGMPFVCTCMSSIYHLYVLVCHPYVTRMDSYVTRMYSHVTRMSLVCTPIHPYVVRMYSYVVRMSLVCGFTMNRY